MSDKHFADNWISDWCLNDTDRVKRDQRFAHFRAYTHFHGLPQFSKKDLPEKRYWAVTLYDDATYVSRNPELFCASEGYLITDLPKHIFEYFGSLLALDNPRHHEVRSIVQRAFGPTQIADVTKLVERITPQIIDEIIEKYPERTCDIHQELSARIPTEITCEMMGVADEDKKWMHDRVREITGNSDPEYHGGERADTFLNACISITEYAGRLAEERRQNPKNDLTSLLVNAKEGGVLNDADFGSLFMVLIMGGIETTQHVTSGGIKRLTENPDQRKILWDNYDDHWKTAIEEMARLQTPAMYFRRTATEDTELHGTEIKKGDKVVVWYYSANRDETVFRNAETFDVTRDTHPSHVAYGAPGIHHCIGAPLARAQLRSVFANLIEKMPDIRYADEIEYGFSKWGNGIKRMKVKW